MRTPGSRATLAISSGSMPKRFSRSVGAIFWMTSRGKAGAQSGPFTAIGRVEQDRQIGLALMLGEQLACAVGAAVVDENYFAGNPAGAHAADDFLDCARLIENRYHHRQQEIVAQRIN